MPERLRRVPAWLAALVGYAVITVAWFEPRPWEISDVIHGTGDAFNYAWRIAWYAGDWSRWGDSFWNATSVFYPHGLSLANGEFSPVNMIPAVAISRVLGPVAAYNIIVLVSFIAAAIAAYAFGRVWGLSGRAAFIAGLVFSFAPYHTAHALGHLPLMGMWVLPVGLICVEKMARTEPGSRRRRAWTVGLGMSIGLAAGSSWYYFAMFGIAFAVYAFVRLRPDGTPGSRARFWMEAGLALVVGVVCTSPMLVIVSLYGHNAASAWSLVAHQGTSPLGYALPAYFQTWWGLFFAKMWSPRNVVEDALFVGWSVMALAWFGWRWRGKRPDGARALVWVAVAAFVLSLGPSLYISSKIHFTWPLGLLGLDVASGGPPGFTPIPMPALLLVRLPVFSGMRAWPRFGVVVLLAAGVVAGLGVDRLLERFVSTNRAVWKMAVVTALIALVVCVEFVPMSWNSDARPTAEERFLAEQPGMGAVMRFPYDAGTGDRGMYSTVITGKPIVYGDTTHIPAGFQETAKKLKSFPDDESIAELQANDVEWVVIEIDNVEASLLSAAESSPDLVERFRGEDTVVLQLAD